MKKINKIKKWVIILAVFLGLAYAHATLDGISLEDFKPVDMKAKHIAELRVLGKDHLIAKFYPEEVQVKEVASK